jgi:hypothetical protein
MKKLPKNLIKAFIGAIFVLGIFVISKPEQASADGCVVSAAGFRHLVPTTNPANFYHDQNRPVVYIDFMTQGCQGSSFEFSITKAIGEVQTDDLISPDIDAIAINNLNVPIPVNGPDNFTVVTRAGEDHCGLGAFPNGISVPGSWDCSFYLSVFDSNGESIYNTIPVAENGGLNVSGGGMLEYNCSGTCNISWQIIPPFIIEFQGVLESDQFNQPVGPGLSIPEGDFYLAPLPGFPSNQPTNLGDFLRGFFRVLIVVAGILAFIMIVIGAITWASSDAISGKGEGKQMIQDAILGLVLALGAWVILNTINPNLASNLGITIPTVYINPEFEPETGIGTGANGESITLSIAGGGTISLNACDNSRMEQVTAFGKTFKIYEGLVSSIEAVNQQWLAAGGNNFYEVKSIGGYNCRKVKGTSTWSAHAFGVAVDINPTKNPFSPPSQNQLTTDMPPEFVQMWTSQGWGWGGAWTTLKDAMHFSKYPPSEGGNGVVQN